MVRDEWLAQWGLQWGYVVLQMQALKIVKKGDVSMVESKKAIECKWEQTGENTVKKDEPPPKRWQQHTNDPG